MKKALLSLTALATMGLAAQGQISLSQSDFPQTGTTINTYTLYNPGTYGDSVSMGVGTTNEAYNFAKMANKPTDEHKVYNFIAASASPYAAEHTGANVAFINYMEMSGNDTILLGWKYLKVDATSAKVIGVTYEVDTAALLNNNTPRGREVIGHATYSSPEIWANTSYAKPYTTSSESHASLEIPSLNFTHTESFYRDIEVDGYGKLRHPNFPNDDIDVLRVKVRFEEWNRDSVMGVQTDHNRDTLYFIEYWGLGYGLPIITAQTSSNFQEFWGVTYNDISAVHTGVTRINPADFDLYPNPASTSVNIDFAKTLDDNYAIKIYNNLGQVISQSEINAGADNVQIDVSDIPKGAYYISLEGGNGEKILTKKLIIN